MTTTQHQWATETYVKSEMDLSMEDIRRYFPLDLTGSVTKSGEHPVASGSYGDIFKGRLSANGKGTDVRCILLTTRRNLTANRWQSKYTRCTNDARKTCLRGERYALAYERSLT